MSSQIKPGDVFVRLTVLERRGRDKWGAALWRVQCECGTETVVPAKRLRDGRIKSCGCLSREMTAARNRANVKHGHNRDGNETPEYRSWASLRNRCTNPQNPAYKWYGGRGITVCERWNSFEAFLEDMGPRPPGTSIDRINNDGNYEPTNCWWVPPKVQAVNRRRKHSIGQ